MNNTSKSRRAAKASSSAKWAMVDLKNVELARRANSNEFVTRLADTTRKFVETYRQRRAQFGWRG